MLGIFLSGKSQADIRHILVISQAYLRYHSSLFRTYYRYISDTSFRHKFYITGCPKKIGLCFCLISRQPSTGFSIFFSSWKLRSIRKFWVHNHFCAIFAKQIGILDYTILIKTEIFKTIKIKTVITSIQILSLWATRPTKNHLGAIRAPLGPIGGALCKFCGYEATMRQHEYELIEPHFVL